jgi:hypothetical protein
MEGVLIAMQGGYHTAGLPMAGKGSGCHADPVRAALLHCPLQYCAVSCCAVPCRAMQIERTALCVCDAHFAKSCCSMLC